jgi:cation diffusion facilitator family transporter
MHAQSLDRWQHTHVFLGEHHARNERKTWLVIGLTAAMMVGEITGGTLFGSMALIADGLHMSTHAGALLIAALAYTYARRHAENTRFAFGTGKLGDLAGYTSAIVLAMIALLIGYEAIDRLIHPIAIAFDEAIAVACLGLGVNLASAWLLRDEPHRHGHDHGAHDHDHDHEGHDHAHHDHGHRGHRDLNLRSAYVHVLADAATSVLAIVGLLAGRLYGWVFMDAVMGIVGACVIANWSYGLIRDAGSVLLDVMPDPVLAQDIKSRLETGEDRITDLHLWRVGPGHYGAIISLVTHEPEAPSRYKARLAGLGALAHVTVEVEACG